MDDECKVCRYRNINFQEHPCKDCIQDSIETGRFPNQIIGKPICLEPNKDSLEQEYLRIYEKEKDIRASFWAAAYNAAIINDPGAPNSTLVAQATTNGDALFRRWKERFAI